jgi:NTE family protein
MTKKTAKHQLNLALQGGGAHGAFTWGVLDRLIEEEDIEVVGISGTSAGAMNAAVMIDGFAEGGREGARKQLAEFWHEISQLGALLNPAPAQPFQGYMPSGFGFDWLAGFNPLDMLSRTFSPYELNPLNINPLRDVLERVLNVKNLHGKTGLFVSATNVETGQPRIFKGAEITIDVLLASSCLPFIFQAVEIDGVPYWDGGYMGNPAIWPLIYNSDCDDVLLVQINPIVRPGTPKHSIDIINRLNEITFNSSLVAEMRAINFVKKLIEDGKLDSHDYHDMRMHLVHPPEGMHDMNASTKTNTDWHFFQALCTAGRIEMEHWLKKHKKDLGKRSTIDIAEHFLVKQKKCVGEHATSTLKTGTK